MDVGALVVLAACKRGSNAIFSGSRMVKSLIIAVSASLVMFFATMPAWASGALGVMTLNLEPTSGQVGAKVVVSGKNAPQTALQVWIAPESDLKNGFQLTASVQPDKDGSWQAQVDIPREWPKYVVVPGKYLVTVQSPDKSYMQQGEFSVLSAQGESPSSVPLSAKPGVFKSLSKSSLVPVIGLLAVLGAVGWAVNHFGKKTS